MLDAIDGRCSMYCSQTDLGARRNESKAKGGRMQQKSGLPYPSNKLIVAEDPTRNFDRCVRA